MYREQYRNTDITEQEKPAATEDRAKEPDLNVSTPEFIDRLLREKGLR